MKRGEAPGYPRYKPASRWKQLEFPHGNRALKFSAARDRARVPGVGTLRLRKGRTLPNSFGRAWLVERNDRWHLCIEHEIAEAPKREIRRIVGVDRGVHVLAATSEGDLIRNPRVSAKRAPIIARLQRELDKRTCKDSRGRCLNRRDPARIAAAKRLARAKEREANARRDYLHKKSRELLELADCIAIEELKVRNMTRSAKGTLEAPGHNVRAKSALNRAVLDASFGRLQQMIVYKAAEAGKTVVAVDPRFSSQTCYKCGHCERGNRVRRRFRCRQCGFAIHADVAAALEIRRRAQKVLLRMADTGAEPVMLHDAA